MVESTGWQLIDPQGSVQGCRNWQRPRRGLCVKSLSEHRCTATFSNNICEWKWVLSCFSRVWLFAMLWTVVHQAALSMRLSRQEYCCGLPCPPPGNLPDRGIEPASLMSPALTGGFFTTSTTWKALGHTLYLINNSSMALSYFLSISNSDHGEGTGTPLHYSCLENPMDRGAW